MDGSEKSSSDSDANSSKQASQVSEKNSASDPRRPDDGDEDEAETQVREEEVEEIEDVKIETEEQTVVSSGQGDGYEATVADSEEGAKDGEDEKNVPIENPSKILSELKEVSHSAAPSKEVAYSKRLVSDAVPMMNTQQDRVCNLSTKSSSPQPLKLQNYPNIQGSVSNPGTNRPACNSYQATSQPGNRSRPEAVSVWASGSRNSPAPQPLDIPPAVYQVATANSPPWRAGELGGRKVSAGNATYIGSRVIAEQTGPSLTVMLRKPTSERQWGFSFHGGAEYGCPPFVNKMLKNSLAGSFGLEIGDVLVSISNALTVGKTQDQLKAEILRAGNELELIVIRRGVDLTKIAELVPQALPTSPRSLSSNSPLSSRENSAMCVFDESRQRSARSLNRPQLYRPVRTKSMRILEDQLNAGEATSVLATKQHFQGARGLAAQGERSSFTQAYGETQASGYTGRVTVPPAVPVETACWLSQVDYQRQHQQALSHRSPEQLRAQQSYRQSNWGQPPSQPPTNWESRSAYAGYQQAQTTDSRYAERPGRSTNYPGNVNQGPSYSSSTTVTIPMRGRQPYDSRMAS